MSDQPSSRPLRYVFAPLARPAAPPDLENPGCVTGSIHAAAKTGDLAALRAALDLGADPNAYSDHGLTPLHLASSLEKVQLLLDSGADPRRLHYGGYSPVHFAMTRYGVEADRIRDFYFDSMPIDILMQKTYRSNSNLLHLAAYCDSIDEKNLDRLLALGLDINARDNDGNTPLMVACVAKNTRMAEALIARGADVVKGKDANHLLSEAVNSYDPELVQALIDAGADVNAPSGSRSTPPLVEAAFVTGDNSPVIGRLLAAGADPDARTRDGTAALHSLQVGSAGEMIHLFRAVGADFSIQDNNGRTPMHALLNTVSRCRLGPIDEADELKIIDVLSKMIEAGADPQKTDSDGRRPYEYAYSFSLGRTADFLETARRKPAPAQGRHHAPR